MNLALTNYGLRYVSQIDDAIHGQAETGRAVIVLLRRLRTEILLPYRASPVEREAVARRLAEPVPDAISREHVALQYKRNPLEHVKHIAFEFTSRCNMHCRHCYNAPVERTTETDLASLKAAVDTFLPMGIERFFFVGGEVSKFGNGWLEIVRHIRNSSDAVVTLFTNGWWLERRNFDAAGRTYSSDVEYLTELEKNGLTDILFSIDGSAEVHDRCRGVQGLFDRVLDGFGRVRAAGLKPRVSVLVRGGMDDTEYTDLLDRLANRIYSFSPGGSRADRIETIAYDPLNIFTNLIDIGNQATANRTTGFHVPRIPDEMLYCKGFYRPAPMLTIKANGEVATCRLATAGEGYGNIHKQDLVQILNHMQRAFVFRLHAERRIAAYRDLLDPEVFGEYFTHVCAIRAILTLLARRIDETGINPRDHAALRRINLEVAKLTGHRKSGLLTKAGEVSR